MSTLRVNDLISENGTGAVGFSKGINISSGVVTATTFKGAFTGDVTGNATGLTGTPDVTMGLVTAQDITVGGAVTVTGNLTVDGTQTIINTDTLDVADSTVGIGSTSNATDTTANGAGIEIYASSSSTSNNKTLTWSSTGYNWTFAKGGLVVDSGGANITGIVTASDGFQGRTATVPINTQGGTYTLVKGDAGKFINAGGAVTVNVNVFAVGDVVSVFNDSSSGTLGLTQGTSVTLHKAGENSDGSQTISIYGVATILCVGASGSGATGNEFVVTGNLE